VVVLGFESAHRAPLEWRRIGAINGRGEMLLGPDEFVPGQGAMVIAPPGVLLRGPKGVEGLTSRGWRLARWGPNETGDVLVDQSPPLALAEVELGQVVEDLAEWAPEQLIWVAGVLTRNTRVLVGRMRRDCTGVYSEGFEHAASEVLALSHEADEAFARVRHSKRVPHWLTERYFSSVRQAYVLVVELDDKTNPLPNSPRRGKAGTMGEWALTPGLESWR
jgi:hypothetical protein